jgi:hypothetical protein
MALGIVAGMLMILSMYDCFYFILSNPILMHQTQDCKACYTLIQRSGLTIGAEVSDGT